MDFDESLKQFAATLPNIIKNIKTEEATKTGLVMPFLSILGYNVFNPAEVCPECIADVGTKKGEKVDYAIMQDGKPIILIECKSVDTDLSTIHQSQLYRYFTATTAKIGILTNGIKYLFYSDFDDTNKMDSKAFFEFDMTNLTDQTIEILKQFRKDTFNVEKILPSAMDMKYIRAIKQIIASDLENPSDDYVKYYASQVYDGRLTRNVLDNFATIVKKALNQYVNDTINIRLKSAMTTEEVEEVEETIDIPEDDGIVTTDEEIEGFNIVRAILSEIVSPERIFMRDVKSYCGVLLDDNNRKQICRMYFNSETKRYFSVFINSVEEKFPIEKPVEIYRYSAKVKAALNSILTK